MSKKLTYEFIKEQIEKEGYKLLSKKYINAKFKLKVRCDKGHEYEVTYNDFQQRKRCSICMGNKKYSYRYIKEQIEKEGHGLLSKEYIGSNEKLLIKCDRGHEYEVTYSSFQQGHRCFKCWNKNHCSKVEKEILEIIKNILSSEIIIIANDKTQILNPLTNRNLELDIWIPELNKAIEFNGIYWHSLEYAKYKDRIKTEQCKEKNIDLLVIQEQDWMDDKNKEIEKIKEWIKI